jgi:hypothetical protein
MTQPIHSWERKYVRGDVIWDHAHQRYCIVLESAQDVEHPDEDGIFTKVIYRILVGTHIEIVSSHSYTHIPAAQLDLLSDTIDS